MQAIRRRVQDAAQDDDRVRAEPGGVGERGGLVHAAPAGERLEVAEVAPGCARSAAPSSTRSSMPSAASHSAWRRIDGGPRSPHGRPRRRGTPIGDVGGDVLLAGRVERLAAGVVAAIRAQPGAADPADEGRGVRQVVDDHDLTVANDRRGLLEPGPERLAAPAGARRPAP